MNKTFSKRIMAMVLSGMVLFFGAGTANIARAEAVLETSAVVANPANHPATAEQISAVAESYLLEKEAKVPQRAGYTGVIVDVSSLGLEKTYSPVIYDTNGRAIYGMKDIDPEFAISKGMVEYAVSSESTVEDSHAGANPLVVKAVAVQGRGNSLEKMNVIVSVEDGDRILLANENAEMLKKCAVVFIK